jgi:hypothetical protein
MDIKLTSAFALARDKVFSLTGKRQYKHVNLLAAIGELTGVPYDGGDRYDYLMSFVRQAAPQQPAYAPGQVKQYVPDTAMRLAAARARTQPDLVSMNSNVRVWNERGEK